MPYHTNKKVQSNVMISLPRYSRTIVLIILPQLKLYDHQTCYDKTCCYILLRIILRRTSCQELLPKTRHILKLNIPSPDVLCPIFVLKRRGTTYYNGSEGLKSKPTEESGKDRPHILRSEQSKKILLPQQ